jgi:hypothetical protein
LLPAQSLKALLESPKPGFSVNIIISEWAQNPDPPHPLALLRARRKWPPGRNCYCFNEIASSHCRLPAAGYADDGLQRPITAGICGQRNGFNDKSALQKILNCSSLITRSGVFCRRLLQRADMPRPRLV